MIPILEEDGIAMAPVDTLPSVKAFIQMVWGHLGDNINSFKGFSHNDMCCKDYRAPKKYRPQLPADVTAPQAEEGS